MLEITTNDIKSIQESWGKAVISQNIDDLMSLYSDNAALKPTLSPVIRRTHSDIKAYFVGGGPYNDSGFLNNQIIDVEFAESEPILLGSLAIDTGIYIFKKQDGDVVEAHYTFCYQKNTQNKIVILTQHSSMK